MLATDTRVEEAEPTWYMAQTHTKCMSYSVEFDCIWYLIFYPAILYSCVLVIFALL